VIKLFLAPLRRFIRNEQARIVAVRREIALDKALSQRDAMRRELARLVHALEALEAAGAQRAPA
jgi:hypothetical protein